MSLLGTLLLVGSVQFITGSSDRVTVHACLQLFDADFLQLAALRQVARTLPSGNSEFTQVEVQSVSDGSAVRALVWPDSIHLLISAPRANQVSALNIALSLLRSPRLPEVARPELPTSDWERSLAMPDAEIAPASALEQWRKSVRPERLTWTFSGTWDQDATLTMLDDAAQNWPSAPQLGAWQTLRGDFQQIRTVRVSALQLLGPELSATGRDLSSPLLAASALGIGKGSSLHRVWRDGHGWSYRQEALLRSTGKGFQVVLNVLMRPRDDLAERGELGRELLRQDIASWTEQDRRRALGIWIGVLRFQSEFTPLYLGNTEPLLLDEAGNHFLAAYWPLKTGQPWEPERLIQNMSLVSLDELKAEALDLVNRSSLRFLEDGRSAR